MPSWLNGLRTSPEGCSVNTNLAEMHGKSNYPHSALSLVQAFLVA